MKKKVNTQLRDFLKDKHVKYLFKNSSYRITFEGLSILLGFFISWCFGNFSSVEFYGNFLFINSIFAIFMVFSFTGMRKSLLQYVAKGYEAFFNTVIKKIFFYSISGSISLFFFALIFFFFNFNFIILITFLIGVIFFPFYSTFSLFEQFLAGKKMFKKNFMYSVIVLSTQNVLLLILIFVFQNLFFYFFLYFGISSLLNILFNMSCMKLIRGEEMNVDVEKEAVIFGLFMTKYDVFGIICENINNLIIGIIFTPSILALYLIGIRLPLYTSRLFRTAISVQLPKYSQKDSKISRRIFYFIILVSIILFIGNFLFIPLFLKIFFPIYISSKNYGQLYSFILLIYPVNVLLNYYFRGKTDKKIIKYSKIYPEIINLISIYPLFMLFGIYGLILSAFLRYVSESIIYFRNYGYLYFD